MHNSHLYNPHMEGEAFTWEGGPVGILLIHGFTATTAEVRLLAKYFHTRGFTVSGPLLPGHGTRPEDLNQVRWQDWAEDVEACYQELKVRCQQVFVGGESTGGLLALYLAAAHPEIAGVLAYAPALRLQLSWLDRLRLYLLAPFLPHVPKGNMDSSQVWQGYPVNPLKGTIQLLRLQNEVMPRLKDIQQPVLVCQGTLDKTVDPGVPELILQSVSSKITEQHWFEKSAHCVALDQEWEVVADVTLDFINKVTAKHKASVHA
jgi:carboxylesterase